METPTFLQELSTFELLEYLYMARDAAAVDLTSYMTGLFAFLVTAHFIGDKLSRFQIGAVLFIYSLYMMFAFQSLYIQLENVMMVVKILRLDENVNAAPQEIFYGLLITAWVISIGFLVEIRMKSNKMEST